MNNTAWHFTGNILRDGSPIPAIGETLVFPHKVEICCSGYHWSLKPHQALKYAPGTTLHKVRFGGDVEMEHDKGVSSERTIIASIDATHLLKRFAADQALGVSHLWDMPKVVHYYLTTLDESQRGTAFNSARATAEAAAGTTSWATAEVAAWATAEAAIEVAADAAAGTTSWYTAEVAACATAEAAAWATAEAAARATARDSYRATAWDAAMQEFDRRVYEAFE
jgi:hypothetical protein